MINIIDSIHEAASITMDRFFEYLADAYEWKDVVTEDDSITRLYVTDKIYIKRSEDNKIGVCHTNGDSYTKMLPITAYNRISDSPITVHSNIYEPNFVVVVDDTLLDAVDVTAGLKPDGAIIINSTKNGDELRAHLKGYTGDIYRIDARKVSMETLGKYFPNTPMLAAVVKVSKIMSEEAFLDDMIGSFKHKFAKKPEVIEGNMKALEMALKEVTKV